MLRRLIRATYIVIGNNRPDRNMQLRYPARSHRIWPLWEQDFGKGHCLLLQKIAQARALINRL